MSAQAKWMWDLRDVVLTVACSYCDAAPGKPCTNMANAAAGLLYPHPERYVAASRLRMAASPPPAAEPAP